MIDRIKDRIGIDWSATRPGGEKRARIVERREAEAGRELLRETVV